ncbi:aspartic peptidase domain-containing protein [Gloeopeniophorella convolvens]|nr:aspartic peptidase domain-containing protein [Gloeopeniophorella convolvens]
MILPLLSIFFLILLQTISHAQSIVLEEALYDFRTTGHDIPSRRRLLDAGHFVDITFGGQPFSVRVDTGSSDLWVAGTVADAADTCTDAIIDNPTTGQISGPVKVAQLQIMAHTAPGVPFVEVAPSHERPAGQGVIGLAPPASVGIDAPGKYVTVLLGRGAGRARRLPAQLTMCEAIPGFDDVLRMPRLPLAPAAAHSAAQRWQVLLDPDGIAGPDLRLEAAAEARDSRQLTAVLDTGSFFSRVPKEISDAMYSHIKGAQLQQISDKDKSWVIPCDTEVNVTFTFGGVAYPVHPLDANVENLDEDGNVLDCIGSFLPASSGHELILGATWLRNTYLLLNFGDEPSVQMLPTTQPANAHIEFIKARRSLQAGAKLAVMSRRREHPGPAANSAAGHKIRHFLARHKVPFIVGGSVLAGSLVAMCAGLFVCRRRRQRRSAPRGPRPVIDDDGVEVLKPYRSLDAPAPAGELREVEGYRMALMDPAPRDGMAHALGGINNPRWG